MVINKLLIRPFTYLLRGLDSHDNMNSSWFLWVFVLIFVETSKSKTEATVMQHPCSSKRIFDSYSLQLQISPTPKKISCITTLVPLDFPPKSILYEMPVLENVLTRTKMSNVQNPLFIYLYIAFHYNYSSWTKLVNRDPYNGLSDYRNPPYNWVGFHPPIYNANNPNRSIGSRFFIPSQWLSSWCMGSFIGSLGSSSFKHRFRGGSWCLTIFPDESQVVTFVNLPVKITSNSLAMYTSWIFFVSL